MRYIIFFIALFLTLALSWALTAFLHNSPSYLLIIPGLLLGILVILGGCEFFANGVECAGKRLNLSHATVGSLFAAVGTALPETMVPIIALITGGAKQGEHIAVGAIIGAPFMLSTLALFLLGTTVFSLYLFRKRDEPLLKVNLKALRFELLYFIAVMLLVLFASLQDSTFFRHLTAVALLAIYIVFFYYSLKHESVAGEEYTDSLHLSIFTGCPVKLRWIILQILVGLSFIVSGAHLFVGYLAAFSVKTGVSPIVLSLLITPVATELPEKFNSITWTIKGKDTIGLGNITGAMVFQSTIPMSIGFMFTEWQLKALEIYNIVSTILMAALILGYIHLRKRLPGWLLLLGGLFYLFYILRVFL